MQTALLGVLAFRVNRTDTEAADSVYAGNNTGAQKGIVWS